VSWSVEILNTTVERELEELPDDMKARFMKIVELIQEFGLENVGMPYVRSLGGKLWEMRIRGKAGVSRAMYVTATGRRVVVVRVFVKKTQKTPAREIKLALKRAAEIQS
jgi:phage-related protein